MKTLYLVRHGKSELGGPSIADFDRPLNERGLQTVPLMGMRLRQADHIPQHIISSPAVRASTTAQLLAEQLDYPLDAIIYEPQLYQADEKGLLMIVNELNEGDDHVMLVGHNPGMSLFANYLTGGHFGSLPTSSIFAIHFKVDEWSAVRTASGKCWFFEHPKKNVNKS